MISKAKISHSRNRYLKQNTITIRLQSRNGLFEIKDTGDTVKEVMLFVCFVLLDFNCNTTTEYYNKKQRQCDEHEEFITSYHNGYDIINWYDKL